MRNTESDSTIKENETEASGLEECQYDSRLPLVAAYGGTASSAQEKNF